MPLSYSLINLRYRRIINLSGRKAMGEIAIHNTSNGSCTLWTPWGPQATTAASPHVTALRKTLRKMSDKKEKRRQEKLKADLAAKPECAYDL